MLENTQTFWGFAAACATALISAYFSVKANAKSREAKAESKDVSKALVFQASEIGELRSALNHCQSGHQKSEQEAKDLREKLDKLREDQAANIAVNKSLQETVALQAPGRTELLEAIREINRTSDDSILASIRVIKDEVCAAIGGGPK